MSRIVGWARDAVRVLFEPRDAGDFALCYALLLLGGYGMPWPFLAVVAAFNAYLLYGSLQGLGRLREVHHGYLGLALCCAPWPWLRAIGVVLLVDDTQFQHVPQFLARLRLQTPRPDDTPIHALGAWLLQRYYDLRGWLRAVGR